MLRGLRFQNRLRPGVPINLSRSSVSTSVGPRGADGNIGPQGVSANAGIPGSGLSTRARIAKPHSAMIGVAVLALDLGFAAYKNMDRIGALLVPAPATTQQAQPQPTAQAGAVAATTQQPQPVARRVRVPLKIDVAYVRRGGSVLRETEKTSGKTLKKYDKGVRVTVLAVDGPWAKVKDGALTG